MKATLKLLPDGNETNVVQIIDGENVIEIECRDEGFAFRCMNSINYAITHAI